MSEWFFKFMMQLLIIVIITGVIFLAIWKIATVVMTFLILLPFSLTLYYGFKWNVTRMPAKQKSKKHKNII